jgi:hypothetical protein
MPTTMCKRFRRFWRKPVGVWGHEPDCHAGECRQRRRWVPHP